VTEEAHRADEVSFRETYLVFRRWGLFILLLAALFALLTLVASLLLPRSYTSQVIVSFSLPNQPGQGLLNNLPSLTGLAQGFVDLLDTRVMAERLEVDNPTRLYSARFDDRRGVLYLTAQGRTPAEAGARAERILSVARKYLEDSLIEGVRTNIQAAQVQARFDLQVAQGGLQGIQAQLEIAPDRAGTTNPAIIAALEARGTDPQAARAADPAFTSLSLDESRLRSQIAQLDARINILTDLLQQPESISQLVSQGLLVQVLVPPAEPLGPSFPRPARFTVIAGFLGLLIGVLWAFVAEAIRPRKAEVAR